MSMPIEGISVADFSAEKVLAEFSTQSVEDTAIRSKFIEIKEVAAFSGDSQTLSFTDALYEAAIESRFYRCQGDSRCEQGNPRMRQYIAEQASGNSEQGALQMVPKGQQDAVTRRARQFLSDAQAFIAVLRLEQQKKEPAVMKRMEAR